MEEQDERPPETAQAGAPEPEEVPPPPALPELEELAASAIPLPQEAVEARAPVLAEAMALLHNRLILGGLGLLVVLLLVAIVLFALGGGDDAADRHLVVDFSTPDGRPTAVPRAGLIGRVRVTTSTHNGPGTGYAILGTIPAGAVVPLVGRNADATWVQVIYPPSSQLRGWVDASFIDVTADLSRLTIAGPGLGPSVLIPTGFLPEEPTAALTPTTEVTTPAATAPTETPAPDTTPPEPTPPATGTPALPPTPPPPTPTPPPAPEATVSAPGEEMPATSQAQGGAR